jgi:molybdopterin synthase sulfur carrier subunit
MPQLHFTTLLHHRPPQPVDTQAPTLRQALEEVFDDYPTLRGYILDDQERLRRHVVIFVDRQRLGFGKGLDVPLDGVNNIYVLQALSGG